MIFTLTIFAVNMILLYMVMLYLAAGVLFAIPFLFSWIYRVDKSAAGTSIAFKLIILPGCILFWPVLLKKYLTVRKRNR